MKTSYDRKHFAPKWKSLFSEANALLPNGTTSAAFREAVRDVATYHIGWRRKLAAAEWCYAAEYYVEQLEALHFPNGLFAVD
jgi:hypothetical protein